MKVFLDVGAYDGASAHAARDPKYGFDWIYCFEPASSCWPTLEAIDDDRLTLCRFGLWNRTGERPLYNSGSAGASVFAEKFHRQPTADTALFVRASDWFRENLAPGDEIYAKLNCEGAECDIVEDLLDSGQLVRARSVMIDPDVRKIPSLQHRERELLERLAASGLDNCVMRSEVMIGATHHARIQNWLRVAGAEQPRRLRQMAFVVAEALRGRRSPLRTALRRQTARGRPEVAA